MRRTGWRRISGIPFSCACCGRMVVLGWAAGHNQGCDECFGHWRAGHMCGKRWEGGKFVKAPEPLCGRDGCGKIAGALVHRWKTEPEFHEFEGPRDAKGGE